MCHIHQDNLFEASMIAYVITSCIEMYLKMKDSHHNLVALVSWFNKIALIKGTCGDIFYYQWVRNTMSKRLERDLYPSLCSIIIWISDQYAPEMISSGVTSSLIKGISFSFT